MRNPPDDDPEIAWRIEALRARLPVDGSLPGDLSILVLEPYPGRCPSCGEPQPFGQLGKCTRCCLAAVAVLRESTGRRQGADRT